jgi:hypothetical protein
MLFSLLNSLNLQKVIRKIIEIILFLPKPQSDLGHAHNETHSFCQYSSFSPFPSISYSCIYFQKSWIIGLKIAKMKEKGLIFASILPV